MEESATPARSRNLCPTSCIVLTVSLRHSIDDNFLWYLIVFNPQACYAYCYNSGQFLYGNIRVREKYLEMVIEPCHIVFTVAWTSCPMSPDRRKGMHLPDACSHVLHLNL